VPQTTIAPPPRDVMAILARLIEEEAAAQKEEVETDVEDEEEDFEATEYAFDLAVYKCTEQIHLDTQQSANVFVLRLSGRACQIRDGKWGSTTFHHFQRKFPEWVNDIGDKADMNLMEQQTYVDAVKRMDDGAKQHLIAAGGCIVLLKLLNTRLSSRSIWGALEALTTSPSLRDAFFKDIGIKQFCDEFCNSANSPKAAPGRFLASIARTPGVAACLMRTARLENPSMTYSSERR